MLPQAAVVITTRNRRDDLEKAISSALAQEIEGGLEVIVIDDASTDGTSELVRTKFPEVTLHRAETAQGYIVQRNRGAHLARAPFIFSIDDDACFSTTTIVAKILAQFDQPRIGAVAIPFIDVRQDPNLVRQQAPAEPGVFVAPAFIGTAHALRRDIFLELGGYREFLFHQGEEGDYCLRMLARGYVVRCGRSDPIHHFESPRRDFHRMDIYGRRNNVLFAWHYAPGPYLPLTLAATTWNGLRHGRRVGRVGTMMSGLARGYGAILHELGRRSPVTPALFRLYRELVSRGTVPLAEIEERLPLLSP